MEKVANMVLGIIDMMMENMVIQEIIEEELEQEVKIKKEWEDVVDVIEYSQEDY